MKSLKLLLAVLSLFLISEASAQKKFKFEKTSRDIKKEAKKLEKDGYSVFPGAVPIKQQLNKSIQMQLETNEEGFPKWITGQAEATGQTQAAAQAAALDMAKTVLIGKLETDMRAVIETEVANNQLNTEEAASIQKTMQVSTNKIAKKLTRTITLSEFYKKAGKENIHVSIIIGYSYELARQAILDEMKRELQVESEEMRLKHDKFLNPEIYNQGTIHN